MIANPSLQVPASSAVIGRYALLVMDGLQLLVPQNQVQALEPGFDVQHPDAGGVGWITVAGARSPVYCLSQDLTPLPEAPASRKICVLLESGAGLFGVLCDQVTMFERTEREIRPLPPCMGAAGTPIQGLMLHGEQVLCVSTADDLLTCLDEELAAVREPAVAQLETGGAL